MSSDLVLYFGAVVVVFAFAAWAGWAVAGRRASTPKILPDRVWLCAACKSFNDPTHATCYRCHQPRPDDAQFVVPDPEFRIDQQLGRSKGSTQLGASSPWLAGEEPLRDAWLSEQARASEQALQASEPAPAFWTAAPRSGAAGPTRRRSRPGHRADAPRRVAARRLRAVLGSRGAPRPVTWHGRPLIRAAAAPWRAPRPPRRSGVPAGSPGSR